MREFRMVCCVRGGWVKERPTTPWNRFRCWITGKGQPTHGPGHGEVVTVVDSYDEYYVLRGYEWNGGYDRACFRPLDPLEMQIDAIEGEPEPEAAPAELETA
jgi:hypothetical protein